jgi:hypothetical protein
MTHSHFQGRGDWRSSGWLGRILIQDSVTVGWRRQLPNAVTLGTHNIIDGLVFQFSYCHSES